MIKVGKIPVVVRSRGYEYDDIKELVGYEYEGTTKKTILDYLKAGTIWAAYPAPNRDFFTKELLNDELVELTDGKYHWCSNLVYYVEKYNMKLPDDFIEHVLKQ